MTVGLGLGATRHGERPADGELGRKGISCERTFSALSAPADLEAKVLLVVWALQDGPRSYLHQVISSPLSSSMIIIEKHLHVYYWPPVYCLCQAHGVPAKRMWGGKPTTSARQQRLACTTSGHAAPAALPGNGFIALIPVRMLPAAA